MNKGKIMKTILKYFALILVINSIILLKVSYSQLTYKWDIADSSIIRYPGGNLNLSYMDDNDIVIFGDAFAGTMSNKKFYQIIQYKNKLNEKEILYYDTVNRYDIFQNIVHPSNNLIAVVGYTREYLGYYSGDQFKYFSLLIFSSDSGKTWNRKVVDSNAVFEDISMYDEFTGIILQVTSKNYFNPNNSSESDTLLLTNDGWLTFKKIGFPKEIKSVRKIICVDSKTYLAFFYDLSQKKYSVIKTLDEGNNWDIISNFESEISINDVKYINNKSFFAVGYKQISNNSSFTKPVILRSDDGGNSWYQIQEFWNGIADAGRIKSIDFADSLNGIVSCGFWFYRTADGGYTWTKEYIPSNFVNQNSITQVIYPNKTIAIATLQNNVILKCQNERILEIPKLEQIINYNFQPINNVKVRCSSINGANSYRFKLDGIRKDSAYIYNFENPILDTIVNDTSIILNNLDYYYIYAVWVKAIGDGIESDWTWNGYQLFGTIKNQEDLSPPGLIFPSFNSILSDFDEIEFRWTKVKDVDTYDFRLISSGSGAGYSDDDLIDTTYKISNFNFLPYQLYNVEIRSRKDDTIYSDWSTSSFYTIDKTNSIFEIPVNMSQVFIYPNPVDRFCYLKLNSNSNYEGIINIYNLFAYKVYISRHSFSYGENIKLINLENIPSGFYSVEILISDNIQRGFFIKQ